MTVIMPSTTHAVASPPRRYQLKGWLGAMVVALLGTGCVANSNSNQATPPPPPRRDQVAVRQPVKPVLRRPRYGRIPSAKPKQVVLPKEHCHFIIVVEGMT